jgi:hypothetical protein
MSKAKIKDCKIIKDILKKYDTGVEDVNIDKEIGLKWLNKSELLYLLKELNYRYYELFHSDQWDGG